MLLLRKKLVDFITVSAFKPMKQKTKLTAALVGGIILSTIHPVKSMDIKIPDVANAYFDVNKKNDVISTRSAIKVSYEETDTYEIATESAVVVEKTEFVANTIKATKDKKAIYEDSITSVHFNPNDVTELTGANIKTLNKLLKGTYLEGYGEVFYNMEKKYKINALFSIGNSALESGWGKSGLSKYDNNIYGLKMSHGFSSKAECIEYWFRLIRNHYVGQGLKSMSAINGKYCPPSTTWDDKIISISRNLLTKLN